MRNTKTNKQNGFTLVELAIVLVIIGLIISGVLAGRELISAAELKADIKQYQSYQLAVNTFIGKYNQIPGDIDGDKFGLTGGCDAGTDGDGDQDGLIESAGGGLATHDGEVACFWANLTTDNVSLISGVYDGLADGIDDIGEDLPAMKSNPGRGWGVFTDDTDNFFIAGVSGTQGSNAYATTNVYIPIDAFSIDSKIDDGVPNSGDVQARDTGANTPNTAASTNNGANTTTCINTSSTPDDYQFSALTDLCTLRFKMQTF